MRGYEVSLLGEQLSVVMVEAAAPASVRVHTLTLLVVVCATQQYQCAKGNYYIHILVVDCWSFMS